MKRARGYYDIFILGNILLIASCVPAPQQCPSPLLQTKTCLKVGVPACSGAGMSSKTLLRASLCPDAACAGQPNLYELNDMVQKYLMQLTRGLGPGGFILSNSSVFDLR